MPWGRPWSSRPQPRSPRVYPHDHQIRDEVGKVVGYRNLDAIGQTLAPILLCRRKAELLPQLPERLEKRFFVPMTPEQLQHLTRFMESVERVTGQIPDPLVEEASGEDGSAPARGAGQDAGDGASEPGGDARPGPTPPDSLAALLRTGLEVLSRLAAEPGPAQAAGGAARPPALERVRDERTGEHYLKVRMPPPEVLDRVTGALGALLDSLRA